MLYLSRLLGRKKSYANEWEATKNYHKPGLQDMIEDKIIDHVVPIAEVKSLIKKYLLT